MMLALCVMFLIRKLRDTNAVIALTIPADPVN